ncbi:MAG: thiamine phosphate synthase [Gemmataceae bacterium]|nr:thiamine phosphate synthase [Gemmataceae bacterium]MDW8265602.1 thiamine phosphate synthase [Gemmataceae bacterium]
MRLDCTPAVARALQAAQAWARLGRTPTVEPRHLLYGLLAEGQGRAAVALRKAGLKASWDWPTLHALGENSEAAAELPWSAQTAAILEVARDLAAEPTLSSEFLLLAILQEDSELRSELARHGLQFEQLQADLRASLGPPLRLDEPLHLTDPREYLDTARLLDASANRAREALRVLEDYARFVLDDALLCAELKRLRHDLTDALGLIDGWPELGLTARDTEHDVGTRLSTPQESSRVGLTHVVVANSKRLQEALRSLEEFGKLHGPELGRRFEQLRYRCYTLERSLLAGNDARQRLADACLYLLVSGSGCVAALDWTIHEAIAGGVQIVQLREKHLSDRELLERARKVRLWTRQAGALFIVNDRPDIARLAEADGVHLGQDDLPVREARRILGPGPMIGVSTHNLEQLRQAVLDGATYVGVGPTFPSGTKEFETFAGLDFVRQAAAATSLPAFVLGGISPRTLPAALEAGARRVAVSQAICQADDPRAAAAELRRLLEQAAAQPRTTQGSKP